MSNLLCSACRIISKRMIFKTSLCCNRQILLHIYKTSSTTGIFQKQYEKKFHSDDSCKRNTFLLTGILSIFGMKSEDEKESELIMTMKRGVLAMQRSEFKKAEQMLHLALRLAQDQQNQLAVYYIYDLMANLAFETGEWAKSEKLFVNVMQHLISTGTETDSDKVIHISLKLAKIYEEKKEVMKAEQGYKYCLEKLEERIKSNKNVSDDTMLLLAMTLDWYSKFLIKTNHVTEAFSHLKRSYDICTKVNGKSHEQCVVLLNDLGTVANLLGDSNTAMNYLKEAVEIGRKLPEMEDLSSIYINLGRLYLENQMYEESKKACENGVRLAKQFEDRSSLMEGNKCLKEVIRIMKSS